MAQDKDILQPVDPLCDSQLLETQRRCHSRLHGSERRNQRLGRLEPNHGLHQSDPDRLLLRYSQTPSLAIKRREQELFWHFVRGPRRKGEEALRIAFPLGILLSQNELRLRHSLSV